MNSKEFIKKFNDYLIKLSGIIIKENQLIHEKLFYFNDHLFAVLNFNKEPYKLSVICDKKLANLLKSRYEEVVNPTNLYPEKWITIILTGQLTTEEVLDLFRHAYEISHN